MRSELGKLLIEYTAVQAYSCLKTRRSEESAAAALLSVAQYYGLPLSRGNLSFLTGTNSLKMDSLYLLFAARKLGFEPLPLEGDFEHLPEVVRPCIVTFRNAGPPEFAVLYEIDEDSALIGNTATGTVDKLDRESFRKRWNGEVVQMLPDSDGFQALRHQIAELHDPRAVLRRVFGLRPRSLPRLVFVPASVAILLLVITWPTGFLQKLVMIGIGLCLILSLWSWAYSAACASCGKVKQAAGGLSLAQAGALFYALLLVLNTWAQVNTLLIQVGLLTASGIHLFLLGLLARSKLICWPCLATAISVFGASIFCVSPGWQLLAVPGGLLLAALLIVPARKIYALQHLDAARRLAVEVFAETAAREPGRVRMVVYVRKHCPVCAFYEAVLRPSIEEEFGEKLSIEEREAGPEKVTTPLYVISGSMNVLAGELPTETAYDRLQTVIGAAMGSEESTLKSAGGFFVIGFGV
jgi:hypothetical protein